VLGVELQERTMRDGDPLTDSGRLELLTIHEHARHLSAVDAGSLGEHLGELVDRARLVEGFAVLIGMDRYALWSKKVRESHWDARGQTLDRDPAP
jgi:hypothetical protein